MKLTCANPDVLFTRLGEESVLLNPVQGIYFGLNDTGTRIWELLTNGNSPDEVASNLSCEFEVTSAQALLEVRDLKAQLLSKSLLIEMQA